MNPTEEMLLQGVPKETNWNQAQVAKVLGLEPDHLSRKDERYGLQAWHQAEFV